MASDPTMIEAPLLPPVVPKTIKCPGDFIKQQSACFKFGSHSSYEMAKTACESFGARLANIDSTFGKFIRDKVRTMGGNDFWIGSFVNGERVYRQKGRTSCPIMRGQVINDALYGLVDCNSANRYICQKYGPENKKGTGQDPFGRGVVPGGRPSLPPATTTTEKIEDDDGGGMSPVIYVVITAIILIIALIALKLLIGRYRNDKKTKSNPPKPAAKTKKDIQSNDKGKVFSPKWRKDAESKTTSIDSAVPPSNISTMEKPKLEFTSNINEEEIIRMGRPRVNEPPPTRLPPEMENDMIYRHRPRDKHFYGKTKEPGYRRHRRTYSDPRSDYNDHDLYRKKSRRRHSFYSDYSHSNSESESDSSSYSGHRYGPQKVYQRQASRSQMGREPLHYNMDPSHYGPPRRDRRHHRDSRQQHYGSLHRNRTHHSHVYRNDDDRRDYGRGNRREERYGNYGKRERTYGKKQSRLPTVSAKVQTFERQYFPEPHRLMSWTNMGELNDLSLSAEPLVQNNHTRSFRKEPIRVSRQIYHERGKIVTTPRTKHAGNTKDENHIYESLDESKRNKLKKKAAGRDKNRKKREKRSLQRASASRASGRSVASIQSRRLPTPPL